MYRYELVTMQKNIYKKNHQTWKNVQIFIQQQTHTLLHISTLL